jgi:steroid 5-alpha reductase family enzyme
MAISFAFILVYMIFCYLVCIWQKNNGLVDVFWGLGFVCIAWLNYSLQKDKHAIQLAFNCLITIWGLRLSLFLAMRNIGKEEDFRYAKWRKEWSKNFYLRTFLQVHLLQGFFMLLVALPIIVINQAPFFDHRLLFVIYMGMLFILAGIGIEAIADQQKRDFRKHESNPNIFIESGLWKFSRHPNYFGEVLVWIGVFFVAIPFGNWFITIVSPIVITFLILKVSGIPMLEKKYDENEKYQLYKKRTSAFVPKPQKKI